MKIYSLLKTILFCNILLQNTNAQQSSQYAYKVAEKPWNESFGNHRAVLEITNPAEVIALDFQWRRPDANVAHKYFLIVNATTGDTIKNIERIEVSNEKCHLLFGPVKKKGTYYFYYLPYTVQHGYGFYQKGYLPQEKAPDTEWLVNAKKSNGYPYANILWVEARKEFDSFYPMEVAATSIEEETYRKENPASLYLFPEDRKNTIRMRHYIPMKWLHYQQGSTF